MFVFKGCDRGAGRERYGHAGDVERYFYNNRQSEESSTTKGNARTLLQPCFLEVYIWLIKK
jgi:hypothetical protein